MTSFTHSLRNPARNSHQYHYSIDDMEMSLKLTFSVIFMGHKLSFGTPVTNSEDIR